MARKTVTPGHVVENGGILTNENGSPLDALQMPDNPYAPDMAPQASQIKPVALDHDTNAPEAPDATEDDSGALCLVVLKNGRTFCFRGQLFRKGDPTAAEPETAERLVRSGYFERG